MSSLQFIKDRQLETSLGNKRALIPESVILPLGSGGFSQRNPMLVARIALIQSQPNPTWRELGGELLCNP